MKKIALCSIMMFMAAALPAAAEEPAMGIYSISMQRIDGRTQPLSDYKGQVLLIVNTASRCGFTPQYQGLEELYGKYKDQGFTVLAFPANDFMGQEPGSNEEIKNFCELKYKTSFPLFAKTSVKGDGINPLFKYLTEDPASQGPVTWNFNKFLVGRDGRVVARFDSRVRPTDGEIVAAVEKALSGQ